ncbi:MAG: DUF4179 domain-containing protein [Selenomonadaceae bacterium]|nr:DUF4179 domain-containing protein [Selenomonadaceae bacterium]
MRKLFLTAALIMSMTFISGCGSTATKNYAPYFKDIQNMPLTWTYQNDAEYAQLDTCQVVHDDNDYYEISIKYTYCYENENCSGDISKYRFFRQNKDGVSLPQYSEDEGKTWITIPSWKDKDAVARMQDPNMCGHYPNFAFHYNPRAYYLFCAAYKQAFGKDYIDI